VLACNCGFQWNLYASYVNSSSELEIVKIAPSNSNTFFPVVTVLNVGGMTSSPAMTVFNNRLEIIYAVGSSHNLSVSYTTDGTNYTTTQQGLGSTGLASSNAVALAPQGGTLWMTFQGDNSNRYAWLAHSTDGLNWTAQQYTNVAYGGAPTMVTTPTQLEIAFEQDNSNRALFVAVFPTAGNTLYAQEYSTTNLGSAGSAAFLNGVLYVYYKQDNSQNNLFFNTATSY
jgi:hypothetical protein